MTLQHKREMAVSEKVQDIVRILHHEIRRMTGIRVLSCLGKGGAERNMGAENDWLILRQRIDLLSQPFYLGLINVTAIEFFPTGQLDGVEQDDSVIAGIKRAVGASMPGPLAPQSPRILRGRAAVRRERPGKIMIADHMMHRPSKALEKGPVKLEEGGTLRRGCLMAAMDEITATDPEIDGFFSHDTRCQIERCRSVAIGPGVDVGIESETQIGQRMRCLGGAKRPAADPARACAESDHELAARSHWRCDHGPFIGPSQVGGGQIEMRISLRPPAWLGDRP